MNIARRIWFCLFTEKTIIKLRRKRFETVMPSSIIITSFVQFNESEGLAKPAKIAAWPCQTKQDSIVQSLAIENLVIDHRFNDEYARFEKMRLTRIAFSFHFEKLPKLTTKEKKSTEGRRSAHAARRYINFRLRFVDAETR